MYDVHAVKHSHVALHKPFSATKKHAIELKKL